MLDLNGYYPNEVIGNSPKMFQGELTNKKVSQEISEAVKTKQPFDKIIINYCKDGSLYKCQIKGYPVFDVNGELINFIAFEKIAA
jgi:predicted transglutaminase-like protease